MTMSVAKIRKRAGAGVATVAVDVVRSAGFQVTWQLLSASKVKDLEDRPFAAGEIEAQCASGARSARAMFGLADSKIVMRIVRGKIAPPDLEAFAIATTWAIGRKLRCEHLILETALVGAHGSWELARTCRGNPNGAANAVT